VADAVGAEGEHFANVFRGGSLAGVGREFEAGFAGDGDGAGEAGGGVGRLVATDAEGDDAFVVVAGGPGGDGFGGFAAELADDVDVPTDGQWRLIRGCAESGPDFVEALLFPGDDAGGEDDFGVADLLVGEGLKERRGGLLIVLRRLQAADGALESFDETGEGFEGVEGAGVGDGESRVEAGKELGRERAFEVNVQFHIGESHSCHNSCMLPEEFREEIDAVVGGYHGDPFRILGPHEAVDGWTVRALLPHAESASVVVGNARVAMRRVHDGGFFMAELPGKPERYQLALHSVYGYDELLEDPYRFGPIITNFDLHLHTEGTLHRAWETFGAHPMTIDGVAGVRFAVWAPSALTVTVTGAFNDWDTRRHPMRLRDGGVWELFIPGIRPGDVYKYRVKSRYNDYEQLKCDPYAFRAEVPPKTASVVHAWEGYEWRDAAWMDGRAKKNWLEEPISVYEVHLESWMKDDHGNPLTYRQMAHTLVQYAQRLRYTHIELMPIMEHPYAGSWGYQVTGFYAATSRFGTPEDFMFFVDACHQAGLGVILDWVPGHFPKDAHGLAWFDGTALYEHADPRQGEHRGWGTNVFNYGRNEVRTFLVSNALFWLEQFHIDGLRVDAVASMLFLDYGREGGEWVPNQYGGRENLEAVEFLKQFNIAAHKVPGAITIAEESTSFGSVTKPVYLGGLGFTMKWNMGWMHDMFNYFKLDPIFRRFNQSHITFSLLYAFTENFLLPISHDEVVHGKSSLVGKMPGDEWQRFANVRAFLGYMYGHPGKKLLFMGQEIGQYEEWDWQGQIRWNMLDFPFHRKLQALVTELNRLYQSEPALYQVDTSFAGFEWIDFRDVDASVIAFMRRGKDPNDFLVFVCNFTPEPRRDYRIGVPRDGNYTELLNTDSELFGGSNMGNCGWRNAEEIRTHGHPYSLSLTLPPLSVVVFKPEPEE